MYEYTLCSVLIFVYVGLTNDDTSRSTHTVRFLYIIIIIFIFNCNWVDNQWQEYSAHLNKNSIQSA
jgi:hypothetical protein